MTQKIYSIDEIQDLTDRIFLLKKQIQLGKIHIAEHLIDSFNASLNAIQFRDDGLVNPLTVDGKIRAMSLALISIRNREELRKQASLVEIQEAYFNFLYSKFGLIYADIIKHKITPGHCASVMVEDETFVKEFYESLPDLVDAIKEFWGAASDVGTIHLQDGKQLKTTFGGDLFPAHFENIVSTAGLYIDTIVLPCPIIRIAPLLEVFPAKRVVELLLKHVLTAMTYRDVATADVTPHIVLILPNQDDINDEKRQELVVRASSLTIKHAECLFGRNFESLEHIHAFCYGLTSVDQIMSEIKRLDRFLINAEWDLDARGQLEKSLTSNYEYRGLPPYENKPVGSTFFDQILGRMPQALGILENANKFSASPLIMADTSWKYYKWMLEYESITPSNNQQLVQSQHVTRALYSESTKNLSWLGSVPPESILEIRKKGHAEEIRAILSNGVSSLIGINPDNYYRTADIVVSNLNTAFEEHQLKLKDAAAKKLKFYGIDVSTCLVTGSIAIAAALTENPTLGAISGALGTIGFSNFKDIKTKYKKIALDENIRKTSPTGILFSHLNK